VTSTPLLLARQPILDERQRLYGYEVLHRPLPLAASTSQDPDVATATVSVNAVLDIGLDTLAGNAQVFFNVTRHVLADKLYQFLPPERVVLEILEDFHVDDGLLRDIAEAKQLGYRIALDDFVLSGPTAALAPLADVIKVEVPALDEEGLRHHARELARPGLLLLAEKVETREIQRCCLDAGYDLFQGYYFARPEVVTGSRVAPDRVLLMRLLSEVHSPSATIETLEQLVVINNALAYMLLKYVNSALYGIVHPIESIRHAIVMLGLDRVRTCATMLLLSGIDSKPQELVFTALMRARSCQLIGKLQCREDPQKLFTVGLLSMLDSFLDKPMDEVLSDLPLAADIRAALLEHSGALGTALDAAIAFEARDDACVLPSGVRAEEWNKCYIDALSWTREMGKLLEG
jgi:EAL and modified HD-GYP domain-containing signal transduction protein